MDRRSQRLRTGNLSWGGLLGLLLLAALTCGRGAVAEGGRIALPRASWPASFTSETELRARAGKLKAFFATGQSGSFVAHDGITLHFVKFEHPRERAAIVLVPGRGEPVTKYPELLATLYAEGYSVWAMDLRSQGLSQRISSNPHMIDVKHFDDYVRDLSLFVNGFVRAKSHPRVFCLAHSMGGLVAIRLAQKEPGAFDAMVLSSPLTEINLRGFPEPVAYGILYAAMGSGFGAHYALKQGNPPPVRLWSQEDFRNDKMTHSFERYYAKLLSILENPPRMGGGSYRWLYTTLNATHAAQKEASRLHTPTLILQADLDVLAVPSADQKLCATAPQGVCERIEYRGAYHEILMEKDAIRTDALLSALQFFDGPTTAALSGQPRPDDLSFRLSQVEWHLRHEQRARAKVAFARLAHYFALHRAEGRWNAAAEKAMEDTKLEVERATSHLTDEEEALVRYAEWQQKTPVRGFE